MRYKYYNMLVYGLAIGVAGLLATINMAVDPYGLFHSNRGRNCTVHFNERTTKYLLGHRYIPDNFDAFMVGSSISANWDTEQIHGYPLYNASLKGGNISEGKLIADKVIQRRPPQLLLIIIYPYMTETFGRKAGSMVEAEYWGALGSQQLLVDYGFMAAARMGWAERLFTSYGLNNFHAPKPTPSDGPVKELREFHVEERALKEYADLLDSARRAGVTIVGVIPPVYSGHWQSQQTAYQAYFHRIKPLFRENESIIDFNTPEYIPLCSNPDNFTDGTHLSQSAAAEVVSALDQYLSNLPK